MPITQPNSAPEMRMNGLKLAHRNAQNRALITITAGRNRNLLTW